MGLRHILGIAAMLALAGCLQGQGDRAALPPTAGYAPSADGGVPADGGGETTPPDADGTEDGAEEPADDPAPDSTDAAPAEAGPAAMEDFLPAPPSIPAILRERQAVCERGGGQLVQRGRTGLYDCLRQTRDAGRPCRQEGDCQGACLARSRSCAPFSPLLGCHEVLDAGGARVTLCLE